MTIVIEDGTQVSNSNSYITASELTSFAIARDVTPTTDLEVLIVKSMAYLESIKFKGSIVDQNQSLQWPRNSVYVDGYLVLNTSIPKLLKDAQMAICLEIEAGNNPLSTLKQEKQSVTIGPISTTYKTGSSSSPISRTFNAYLRKLISGSGSAYSVMR